MPVSKILLGRYKVLGNKTIKHQIFCLLPKQVGKEFIERTRYIYTDEHVA